VVVDVRIGIISVLVHNILIDWHADLRKHEIAKYKNRKATNEPPPEPKYPKIDIRESIEFVTPFLFGLVVGVEKVHIKLHVGQYRSCVWNNSSCLGPLGDRLEVHSQEHDAEEEKGEDEEEG